VSDAAGVNGTASDQSVPAVDSSPAAAEQSPQLADSSMSVSSASPPPPPAAAAATDEQDHSPKASDADAADRSPTTSRAINVDKSFGPVFGAHLPPNSSPNQLPADMSGMRFGQAQMTQTAMALATSSAAVARVVMINPAGTSSRLVQASATAAGAVTSSISEMGVDDNEDFDN
jgi:hypothetical protein